MTRVQRYRWVAVLSVGLWVPTVVGLGVWLNPGPGGVATVEDWRTVVHVNTYEYAIVSDVMRANLRAVHQILDAASRQDRTAVARLAQQAADTLAQHGEAPHSPPSCPPVAAHGS